MLHILPEISEQLEQTAERINFQGLPQLLVCCGFFLILVIEQWVLSLQAGQHFARNLRESQK